eukprot:PITA_02694
MDPIISLLRFADTDKPILGEVYEGWDSMIESVKSNILQSECPEYETSPEAFCGTIHVILVSRWDKNCTPLHCLAHSLNPKYYSHEWLNGGPSRRFPLHMDGEISQGRKDAFRQVFQDRALLDEVEDAFAEFSIVTGQFGRYDAIRDRGPKKPYSWWANHGARSPPLQQLAMRLFAQAKEWLKGKTKMWDVFPDDMGLDNSVEVALANMDLNDPMLEPVRFDDGDTVEGSSSTLADAEATLDTGEEDAAEESSGDHDDEGNDVDFDDDYED